MNNGLTADDIIRYQNLKADADFHYTLLEAMRKTSAMFAYQPQRFQQYIEGLEKLIEVYQREIRTFEKRLNQNLL